MEIHDLSASELAALLKKREISSVEAVNHFLKRIDKYNSKFNAFITVDPDSALKQAKEFDSNISKDAGPLGPLAGLPVAVKDLSLTKGMRSTSGSLTLKDNIPQVDSISVERIRKAGGIIVGKTNTPEFGYKGVTDNRITSPCVNPWNTSCTSGGSSGGSAAAVASKLIPMAEGTDGAGSIRIPASFCGVVGFKPSFALVPRYPIPDIYYNLSHTGPIARSVSDAALFMNVLAGPDPRDPCSFTRDLYSDKGNNVDFSNLESPDKLKIAYSPNLGYAAVEPEIAEIVRKAAFAFKQMNHTVEDIDLDWEDPEPIELGIWCAVYAERYGPLKSPMRDLFTPELVEIVDEGMKLSAFRMGTDAMKRTQLYYKSQQIFDKYQILITPTMACQAFPVTQQKPDSINGRKITTLFGWTPFTYPFNLTGQPALTVPCGVTKDSMPVGLQIIGSRGSDQLVLKVGAQFEKLGFTPQLPQYC